MELQSTHNFTAYVAVDAYGDGTLIPTTITGTYSDFGHEPAFCTIFPEKEKLPHDYHTRGRQRILDLKGNAVEGGGIWIPRFRWLRQTHRNLDVIWEGVAELFIHGSFDEFDATGEGITCLVTLPPTPLALSNSSFIPSYDGTITRNGAERKGIRWTTALGEAELIDNYEYHEEKVDLDKARIQIQKCQIVLAIHPSGRTSLGSICNDLENALDEPLKLLSFLSRKRIDWYAAQIYFLPGENSPSKNPQEAIVRHATWLGYELEQKSEVDEYELLVQKQFLADGLFQALLDRYTLSTFKSAINQAIPYLIVSHASGYPETRISLAYSALEGLVGALGKDIEVSNLPDRSTLKNLSDKLSEIIRNEITEEIAAEVMTNKLLSALWNPPLADRLFALVKKYDLGVASLLWPSGADLAAELKGIIGRRNDYVHRGVVADYSQTIRDLWRIQCLAELWILKLLDCPVDAVNTYALSRVNEMPLRIR